MIPKSGIWVKIWLFLIIILAISLRVYFLINKGSFSFDEYFSVYFAGFSFRDIWRYFLYENTPPLYVFILRFLSFFFTLNQLNVSLFSLFISVLSVIGVFILGRKLLSDEGGLVAAFLVSISPLHVFVGVEARTYGLMFLLAIISTYFYWEILEGKKRWFGYVFSSLLLIYSHLFSWFLIFTQIFVLFLSKRRELYKSFIISWISLFFLFLFWFLPFSFNKINSPLSRGAPMLTVINLPVFSWIEKVISFILMEDKVILWGIFFILFLLVGYGLYYRLAEDDKMDNLKIFYCLILLASFLLLSFLPLKYFIVCSLGGYLLLAYFLLRFRYPLWVKAVFFMSLSLLTFWADFKMVNDVRFGWDEIGQYVKDREEKADSVIVSRYNLKILLDYYYQGALNVKYILPKDLRSSDFNIDLIKLNWILFLSGMNFSELEGLLGDDKKIILVSSEFEEFNYIVDWFLKNDWQVTDFVAVDTLEGVRLFFMTKK